MKKPELVSSAASKLRDIYFEMNAMAYLIRRKREDDAHPHEIEEINHGTGRVLERLSRRLHRVVVRLEESRLDSSSPPIKKD